MITFYIVRHGETLFNKKHLMQGWCDSPLTQKGVQMAKDLGNRLKDISFEAVYSSSSERAWDSAEWIIQENAHPLEVVIRKELKEINFGDMEGENEYIGRISQQEYHRVHGWVNEGGESMEMVVQRVEKILDEIIDQVKEGNVLVVTHGVVIMSLLRKWKPGYMEQAGPSFHIHNCSVMKVLYEQGEFTITEVNG